MKAQLLVGGDEVVGEFLWPDDFSPEDIKGAALLALSNFYNTSGDPIMPQRYLSKPVPYEVRVVGSAGRVIHRCNIADLAKSLGKGLP